MATVLVVKGEALHMTVEQFLSIPFEQRAHWTGKLQFCWYSGHGCNCNGANPGHKFTVDVVNGVLKENNKLAAKFKKKAPLKKVWPKPKCSHCLVHHPINAKHVLQHVPIGSDKTPWKAFSDMVVVPYSTKKPWWAKGAETVGYQSFIKPVKAKTKKPVKSKAKSCPFMGSGCYCEGTLPGHAQGKMLTTTLPGGAAPLNVKLPKKPVTKKAKIDWMSKMEAAAAKSFAAAVAMGEDKAAFESVTMPKVKTKPLKAKFKPAPGKMPVNFVELTYADLTALKFESTIKPKAKAQKPKKLEEIKDEQARFDNPTVMRALMSKYRTFRMLPDRLLLQMKAPRAANPLGLFAYSLGAKSHESAWKILEKHFDMVYVMGFCTGFSMEKLPSDFRKISAEAAFFANNEDFRCGVEDAQLAWEVVRARRNKKAISEEFTI